MSWSRNHWEANRLESAFARSSRSIRSTWARRVSGSGEPSRLRLVEQLLVGDRPPEEEREPGSQVGIGDPVSEAGLAGVERLLQPEDEVGAREDALDRHPDTRLESLGLVASLVEREQRVPVLVVQRAAVGEPAEASHDLLGTRTRLFGGERPAGEDALAGRGVRNAGGFERPPDQHVPQVRQAVDAVGERDVGARERPFVRRDQIERRAVEGAEEGRRDHLRTGPDEDRLGAHGGPFRIRGVHPGIHREEGNALAVDRDFELFGSALVVQRSRRGADDRAAHLVVERNPEDVVAVRREGVLGRDTAPGAVGRALDLGPLRGPARDEVAGLRRGGFGVADRETADLARRPQVGIHERRREQLDIGDIVEVGADGVLGEVFGGIHVEIEDVPDRRRVLGPVQSLERAPAGVRAGERRLVELLFERLGDLDEHRLFGAAGTGRRHHPELKLRDHLLGEVRVLPGRPGVEAGERHVAGLHPVVVAGHAVATHDLVVRLGDRFLRPRARLEGEHPGGGRGSGFRRGEAGDGQKYENAQELPGHRADLHAINSLRSGCCFSRRSFRAARWSPETG